LDAVACEQTDGHEETDKWFYSKDGRIILKLILGK
jgi:hypothetical protein